MPDSEQSSLVYTLKGFEDPMEIFTSQKDTEGLPPLKLLLFMAMNKAHGVLTCKDDSGRTWQVGLENGSCYGTLEAGQSQEEALGKKLVEHIGMEMSMVTDILKKSKQSGKGRMGFIKLLLGMDNISARQILQVVRLARKGVLDDIVSIRSGEAVLDPSARLDTSKDPIKIDVLQYVNDHVYAMLKKHYYRDLASNFDKFFGMYPIVSGSMSEDNRNKLLTDDEKKSVENMDGSITLKDYFAMTNLSKHDAARLLTRLLLLNFMKFEKNPTTDASIRKREEGLERFLARFSMDDQFTRLGVHWTAHTSDIEKAFQKRIRDWGPDSDIRKISEKTSKLCEQLFKFSQDAYEILADTEQRQEYRNRIIERRKRIDGADFLYQQAQISLFRGDTEDARRLIESSLDIVEKPLYRKFYNELGGGQR